MTDPPQRPPTNRAAQAGYLLISPAILGFGIGFGIGTLVGFPALVSILGIFAGLIAGFFLVYARFRDL
jgi:Putative F0F1-ATPase subunit Ca2+/Mg2+ transporter